ncbi:hypothetical protein PVAP13_1NG514700 [Panicum virgatum]|uniref:Uncharacterized protein n=1 Tax=Panicum virgatum TaxID=38727 RepID=A0A8T0WW48_PANVG|nr:hypothetical protein PVAP13_1NG514700 [Panicum virgatum]
MFQICVGSHLIQSPPTPPCAACIVRSSSGQGSGGRRAATSQHKQRRSNLTHLHCSDPISCSCSLLLSCHPKPSEYRLIEL